MISKKLLVSIVTVFIAFTGALTLFNLLKGKDKGQDYSADTSLSGFNLPDDLAEFLKKSAREIAHHLGTAYHWADPRYYSENDKEVYLLVSTLTQSEFDVISKLYFDVYAKGRNLSADLLKLLDTKYYKLLIVK